MYRSEMPSPRATTMPTMALVVCVVLASQALAAHSARMNTTITIAETIAKTVARLRKKPTSSSRRLSAAYVSATGAMSNTRVLTRPRTMESAYDDDDEVAIKPTMKKQKKAARGTSVHI